MVRRGTHLLERLDAEEQELQDQIDSEMIREEKKASVVRRVAPLASVSAGDNLTDDLRSVLSTIFEGNSGDEPAHALARLRNVLVERLQQQVALSSSLL